MPNDAAAAQTLSGAQQAILNTRQMAQTFRIDQDGHIESSVQKLLEDPITYAQGLLRTLGPAELNAKGHPFATRCARRPGEVSVQSQRHRAGHRTGIGIGLPAEDRRCCPQFVDANLQAALTWQGSQFVPQFGPPALP